MSRIGNATIMVPAGVTLRQEGSHVTVSGPKGTMTVVIPPEVSYENQENVLVFKRLGNSKRARAIHGSTRAHMFNAVTGVHEGWSKTLEMVGVAYRSQTNGKELTLTVGFSHPVKIHAPEGITFEVTEGKITVLGVNKKDVGEIAAQIRKVRKPEPYKGKGIRYSGEKVRKKAGKAAKAVGGGGTGGK